MKLLIFFTISLISVASAASLLINKEENTLVLTQVVFRHGDRTPAGLLNIPEMPYSNETFFPYGVGQLTLEGKKNCYKMGTELFNRYGKFLGNPFFPDLIQAVSSESDRAIMSLQTVLAALFKPTPKERISLGLLWQPILHKYLNSEEDKILGLFVKCPAVFDVQVEVDEKTQMVYDFLSLNLGTTVNSAWTAFSIQNTFQVLEEMGYKLPAWVKPIWPEPLTSVGLQFWKHVVDQKLPVAAGHLMKTINENMLEKINGTKLKERKLFLYSGHDLNVVAVLGSLGVYDGRYIHYSSYVLIELHNIKGVYGIKAFLQNYEAINPVPISIPLCGLFCPLQDFIRITKKNYPHDPWCY